MCLLHPHRTPSLFLRLAACELCSFSVVPLAPQNSRSPAWLLTSFPTPLSWASTHLSTNTPFISDDVCVGALGCLKGFSEVC